MVIFISLCTVYLSFCASGIKLPTPGCSAALCLQVCSKHMQINVLQFFHKNKQPCSFPTIYSNPTFKTRSQQILASRMANTRTSTVDSFVPRLSPRWRHETTFSGQRISYLFLRMRKRLSTLNLNFSRNVLSQKNLFKQLI